MNTKYVIPTTDIVDLNLLNSVMGPGDAAASAGGEGDDGLVNTIDFEEVDHEDTPKGSSLWD